MKKAFFITALAALTALVSCKRDTNIATPGGPTKVTTINDLKPSENFNWNTTNDVTLNVTGLATQVVIQRPLVIKGMDGVQYFSIYHKMSDNLSTKITLPAHVKKVKVEYGTIVKEKDVMGNTISFNFTPEITNED